MRPNPEVIVSAKPGMKLVVEQARRGIWAGRGF
jgi:hypothetical protein